MQRKQKLVLMRGLPGSGKSTLARDIALDHLHYGGSSVSICSTDDYHMVDGEYVFQPDKLGHFHKMNQEKVRNQIRAGVELVIVDNTNIKRKDMKPYIDAAEEFKYSIEEVVVGKEVLRPSLEDANPHRFMDYILMCAQRNTHGVPRDVIEKMARNFQE